MQKRIFTQWNLEDVAEKLAQLRKQRQLEKTLNVEDQDLHLERKIHYLENIQTILRNPDAYKQKIKKYNELAQISGYKKTKAAEYFSKNPERLRENSRRYYKNNIDRIRPYKAEYKRSYHAINPSAHIAATLRKRINSAVRKQLTRKRCKTIDLLGCTFEHLKIHLESLFADGMSWENYGLWHIDHKIPCAAFDLTKEENQKLCFHYSNLQPLWAKDNLIKSSKRC